MKKKPNLNKLFNPKTMLIVDKKKYIDILIERAFLEVVLRKMVEDERYPDWELIFKRKNKFRWGIKHIREQIEKLK